MSFSQTSGYQGPANLNIGGSLYNAVSFICKQIIAGKAHSHLVKVISVSGGGLDGPPMVAVQPMVDQVDGAGNRTAHGTIFNIPAFRHQSGSLAFVMDPQVGDIGQMVVCDRDISAVKSTGKISGPGSGRQNSFADGMFIGGYTSLAQGGAPTTYIMQDPGGGITIHTNNHVNIQTTGDTNINASGNFTFTATNGTLDASGNLAVKGAIHAGQGGGDQVGLQTHVHAGGPPPTPGT